jgi:hypothetical protein
MIEVKPSQRPQLLSDLRQQYHIAGLQIFAFVTL